MPGPATLERSLKSGVASVLKPLVGSRERSFPPPPEVGAILVVRQHNQLGDMLCVVPLLRALRAHFPAARISLLASPGNADIMRYHPLLDEVVTYDKTLYLRNGVPRLREFGGFVRDLRARAFDVALVPSTVSVSFSSDALAYLSGAPCRVGARSLSGTPNPASFFFTSARDLDWRGDEHRHQTLRNWDLIGLWLAPPADLSHEMGFTSEEKESGLAEVARIRGDRLAIAYHPGAGKAPNRWPADRFAEVARTLAREMNAATFITEGPMDRAEVQVMESQLEVAAQVYRRQPVRAIASYLRCLDLVVTNDTGIMHVAAAAGAPVLSLFGPTDPHQWAPKGEAHRFIVGEQGRIEAIPVEAVLNCAREMLSGRSPRARVV